MTAIILQFPARPAYSAVHPLFFVSFTKAGEKLRGRLLKMCKKAAARAIHRIVREMAEWTASKPEDMLIAFAEAERKLTELTDDPEVEPFVWPVLHQVTEGIEQLLDRLVGAEREGRVTFKMVA